MNLRLTKFSNNQSINEFIFLLNNILWTLSKVVYKYVQKLITTFGMTMHHNKSTNKANFINYLLNGRRSKIQIIGICHYYMTIVRPINSFFEKKKF